MTTKPEGGWQSSFSTTFGLTQPSPFSSADFTYSCPYFLANWDLTVDNSEICFSPRKVFHQKQRDSNILVTIALDNLVPAEQQSRIHVVAWRQRVATGAVPRPARLCAMLLATSPDRRRNSRSVPARRRPDPTQTGDIELSACCIHGW